MIEFLTTHAWIVWLALILIFVIIETLTLDLTFLMLAVGSLGGLAAGISGASWWLQIVIAAVAALLLIFTIRPPLLKRLKRSGDAAKSNVEALLGLQGQVVATVSSTGGQVKLTNGETWTARVPPEGSSSELASGETVYVKAIEGAIAFVSPAERNKL